MYKNTGFTARANNKPGIEFGKVLQREKAEAKKIIQKGKADKFMLALICLLMVSGLITLFSASVPLSLSVEKTPFAQISQQLKYVVFILPLAFLISKIDAERLKKFAFFPMFVISLIFMLLALAVENKHGANRWFDFGEFLNLPFSVNFQPSEVAKLAVILMVALIISTNQAKLNTFKYGFLPFFWVIGSMATLMVLQRHLSGLILIAGIGVVMMHIGEVSFKNIFLLCFLGISLFVVLVLTVDKFSAYIIPRIQTWLDPYSVSSDDAYQIIQSLIAVGSGGLTGRGLGQSIQKHLYLPAMTNDFIFAIFCEEFGFVGAVLLIAVFILLVARGIMLSRQVKDKFSSMLLLGISVQIGLQAILHIAVNVNAFPCTGISLPFFSDGGTSMIILLVEVGIMLSVSRKIDYEKQLKAKGADVGPNALMERAGAAT